ncbi:MAG: preprotein translocase subunit SecE [Candidatus Hydrogenedens sp.]|nr:preprotein translocase subunit SecE [Candidatus Hydrogenedens sp.]
MAKQAAVADARPNPFQRLMAFIEEVRQELDKVTWPTMDDLKVSTKVCMFMLLGMAATIFIFDRVFNFIVLNLLSLAG